MLIFEFYKVEFYFDEKIRLTREILEFFFREIYNFYIVYRYVENINIFEFVLVSREYKYFWISIDLLGK